MLPTVPTPRRVLASAGATRTRLDLALRDGRAVAPYRGVHVEAAHAAGLVNRAHAAIATQGADAVAGMGTAAALLELRWLPREWLAPDATVHVVVPPGDAHRHRAGLRLHRRTLEPADIVVAHGVPCLSPTRTLVELARDAKLPERIVVQVIDGALRDGRTTTAELAACVARFPGERHVARARRVIGRAREGVDSPQETTMRLILEDGGISVEVNIQIRDDDGLLLAAGDLGISRFLLWGEYDGYDAHTDKKAFRGDRVGDRWLWRRGWQPMRFVDVDLHRPDRVCAEWRQAIADAPARIAALDPRRSPEIAAAQRLLRVGPGA